MEWATFKREALGHLKALPFRIQLARFCAAILTAVVAEPMLGWFLAALLGAGVLVALLLRFSHQPPPHMDLAPRPKDRFGREL